MHNQHGIGIKSIFSTVTNFFKNTFSNAWTAVKNVFSKGGQIFVGIKEGILSTFKIIVNGLIDGINKVVSIPFNAINKALTKIKNVTIPVINKQPFKNVINTISVPQIPHLAGGGYFKANQPTLAIVGDNKRQSEIVTPEDKMEEAFERVLARKGLGANQEIIGLLKVIIDLLRRLGLSVQINLDGDELSYKLQKINNKNDFCRNGV